MLLLHALGRGWTRTGDKRMPAELADRRRCGVLFLFFVCEFVLHLARDCINYVRRFYSLSRRLCRTPGFAGCLLVAVKPR